MNPLAMGYTRLSDIVPESSLKRVAFDLTIQETSEGDFDEQGNKYFRGLLLSREMTVNEAFSCDRTRFLVGFSIRSSFPSNQTSFRFEATDG